jgi:hypothetical protein
MCRAWTPCAPCSHVIHANSLTSCTAYLINNARVFGRHGPEICLILLVAFADGFRQDLVGLGAPQGRRLQVKQLGRPVASICMGIHKSDMHPSRSSSGRYSHKPTSMNQHDTWIPDKRCRALCGLCTLNADHQDTYDMLPARLPVLAFQYCMSLPPHGVLLALVPIEYPSDVQIRVQQLQLSGLNKTAVEFGAGSG